MIKLRIARWINRCLGDNFGGSPSPPGSNAKLDFGPDDDNGHPMYIARTHCNDGVELWLGYRWKWNAHYTAKDARRLAWFILWDWWAKDTWFGLRRWIWMAWVKSFSSKEINNDNLDSEISPSPVARVGAGASSPPSSHGSENITASNK